MLGTHFLHRLPKTENIFRAFLHFKLQLKQPSQHPEEQTREAACTSTPRIDRLDYARGLPGPSRNHIREGWHPDAQGQKPKEIGKAPSGFGLGHHPSCSPRHLPALGHNLLNETSQSESGGTGRGMGIAKPVLAK